MPTVLLVRHGQASFGAADYDLLSDLGRRQAEIVAVALAERGYRPSRLVAGTLRRQRETAAAFAAVGAPEPEIEPRWDEFDLDQVLTHHGASATVAYFGWVDTTMVKDALSQPDAERLNKTTPKFLLKRIQPEEAAAAFVRGIEERAPRVFAPKWWRYYSAFRGLINPLLDKRMERDANAQALLRDLDARATTPVESPAPER